MSLEKSDIYTDCSELPIYNFFKVIDERDYKFLFRDLTKDIHIDEQMNNELHTNFKNILAEYNELTNNTSLIREYQEKIRIDLMEYRYNISNKLISMYIETGEFEVILLLKELQWQINSASNIYPQLTRIKKNLIGLKNKIKIAKANFVKKYNKKKQDRETDLEEVCINIEVGIPLSYKINIYEDSIKRLIHYSNILEKRNKKNK